MEDDDSSGRDYPPVLDAALVARLLRLNVDYVRKLSRENKLPAHQIPGGRTYRYFKDEVLDWLRSQPIGGPGRDLSEEAQAQPRSDRDPERA